MASFEETLPYPGQNSSAVVAAASPAEEEAEAAFDMDRPHAAIEGGQRPVPQRSGPQQRAAVLVPTAVAAAVASSPAGIGTEIAFSLEE